MTLSSTEKLDRCLNDIILGQASLESISSLLVNEPEVKELLELAVGSHEALAVKVRDEAMRTTRTILIEEGKKIAHTRRRMWRFFSGKPLRGLVLRPAAIAAVLVLLFAGTAIASSAARPDSFLYPIKQRLEDARTFFTVGSLNKAGVEVSHAGSRLDEIYEMVDAGKLEYVPQLLADYDEHINSARALAEKAAAEGKHVEEILAQINAVQMRHAATILEIGERLPLETLMSISGPKEGSAGVPGQDSPVVPGPDPAVPAPNPSPTTPDADPNAASGATPPETPVAGPSQTPAPAAGQSPQTGQAGGQTGGPDNYESPAAPLNSPGQPGSMGTSSDTGSTHMSIPS